MGEQEPAAESAVAPGRRRRKVLQCRSALAEAAADLLSERGGLGRVGVEEISDRADVCRRTFSRYFAGKGDAVVDVLRADHAAVNAALAARPRPEPPLTAYHRALGDWLADPAAAPRWAADTRSGRVLRLAHRDPALLPAYLGLRHEADQESVRIVAERLRLDPVGDLRPALAVALAAGAFHAAVGHWLRQDDGAPLGPLLDAAFGALTNETASAP